MTGKRLTPDAANAELPLVRALVADVVHATARHRETEKAYRAEKARVQPSQAALNETWRAMRALAADRDAWTLELRALGVEIDDAAAGEVHFVGALIRGLTAGEPALLCWRLGEPRVDTWRREGEVFSARRPLPEPVLA